MAPTFSVVIPLYNVAGYIQDLLNTFHHQAKGNYSIEYIFVDDGSPDQSAEIVRRWIEDTHAPAKLVVQENQGVSAARNLGMKLAKGDWITFPDSDDFLNNTYFKSVAEFLDNPLSSEVTIVATNIIRYFDANKQYKNSHALRFKFKSGDAVVDLEKNPNYIQLSAPTTFFRLETLRKKDIFFKVGLHSSEDALFTSQVLLSEERPLLGVVKGAQYYYRKRASLDSAVDGFRRDPSTYFERFEIGYLELVRHAQRLFGHVPNWLVSLILYEYRWLFTYETNVKTRAYVLSESQKQRFISLTQKVLEAISYGDIENYKVTPLADEPRAVLRALAGERFPNQGIRIADLDPELKLVCLVYWFTGDLPVERFTSNNTEIPPCYSKIRTLDYFGQTILRERIVWVPLHEQLEASINGLPMQLEYGFPGQRKFRLEEHEVLKHFGRVGNQGLTSVKTKQRRSLIPQQLNKVIETLRPIGMEGPKEVTRRIAGGVKRRISRASQKWFGTDSKWFQRTLRKRLTIAAKVKEDSYRDCWLVMDRVDAAGDNAEHLFRYLKNSRPDINAWFVLNRDSRDWERLSSEGFNLLPYGSFEFHTALCLAENFISSHADVEMTDVLPNAVYPNLRRPWKFVFLQHGVTQNDLSLWLNTKDLDLIVTSTNAENKAISGDNSPYKFGSRETVLCGMPRFDALRTLSETSSRKRYLLLSPTWRYSLVKPKMARKGTRRPISTFQESQFYRSWMCLLTDPRLFELATRNNLELVFLPHPNFEVAMADTELDSRIRRISYRETDIQEIFAATSALVTDYSSIAFDLAYIGAEVHYYQFDRSDMLGGLHTMAPGYFEYEHDGFGPVHEGVDSILDRGEIGLFGISDQRKDIYADRVRKTFAFHDSRASERVVAAVEKMRKPSKTA